MKQILVSWLWVESVKFDQPASMISFSSVWWLVFWLCTKNQMQSKMQHIVWETYMENESNPEASDNMLFQYGNVIAIL